MNKLPKPSDSEEEHFATRELEKIKELRAKARIEHDLAERKRLKDLHWMRCPKCGHELHEVEFRKVQVDSCFECGGMFFDKGEVEKMIHHKEPGLFGVLLKELFD
jgi:hypothetical protein